MIRGRLRRVCRRRWGCERFTNKRQCDEIWAGQKVINANMSVNYSPSRLSTGLNIQLCSHLQNILLLAQRQRCEIKSSRFLRLIASRLSERLFYTTRTSMAQDCGHKYLCMCNFNVSFQTLIIVFNRNIIASAEHGEENHKNHSS